MAAVQRAAGDVAKYVGPSERWDWAEAVLRSALADAGVSYVEAPGEAAFYGPKIDIQVSDHADREFTLATMQLDAHLPERFDLSYMDSAGERRRPVMLHRSVVGSFERLFAHLIELHEGAFPAWYAPLQVACLPVSDDELAAAETSWPCAGRRTCGSTWSPVGRWLPGSGRSGCAGCRTRR